MLAGFSSILHRVHGKGKMPRYLLGDQFLYGALAIMSLEALHALYSMPLNVPPTQDQLLNTLLQPGQQSILVSKDIWSMCQTKQG